MNSPVTVTDGEETYEGVVVSDPEPRALVIRSEPPAGLAAVAALSDDEFDANLLVIKKGVERAKRMQEALLVEGTDYGKVKGIDRPFLQKPGAEKFEKAYRLATTFEVTRLVGDGGDAPVVEFIVDAQVHVGDSTGPIVAEGHGEANSHERKYRYRSGERTCPDCGAEAIRTGDKRDGSGREFYCWSKKGGCGHRFPIDDPRLAQAADDVENPDPWDLANTLLKMATKRAHVDAILRATGTSGLFTQDDDSPAVGGDRPRPAADAARPVAQAPAEGPKVPWSVGHRSFDGRVKVTAGGPTDGLMRGGPEGAFLAFKFDYRDEQGQLRHITRVIARGALADDIADSCSGDLRALLDKPVTVEGELWKEPWNDDNGRAMAPWSRLELERLVTPDWTLPVPDLAGPLSAEEVAEAVDG